MHNILVMDLTSFITHLAFRHIHDERLNYSTQRIEMLLVIVIWNLYNPLCRSDKNTAESSRSVKSGAGNTIINREDV